jgi:hypothetical protein
VVRLSFNHPEGGVSDILVGFIVCHSSDLVVVLGNVLGFLKKPS